MTYNNTHKIQFIDTNIHKNNHSETELHTIRTEFSKVAMPNLTITVKDLGVIFDSLYTFLISATPYAELPVSLLVSAQICVCHIYTNIYTNIYTTIYIYKSEYTS